MSIDEEAVRDAQRLLRRSATSVLSTISKKIEGWPFGSIAPYALNARGEPILFISTIAEHTKNLIADNRVSLLVQEELPDGRSLAAQGEVQAHGRITVMGRATQIAEHEVADARARYLSRVPSAVGYSNAHDFAFFRLGFEHVRFIGGFGKIFWLDPARMILNPKLDPLAEGALGIISHMNEDHADSLRLYCRAFRSVDPEEVEMVGVDQFGLDLACRRPDLRLRFDFDEPATMKTIRPIVVKMVQDARTRIAAGDGSHKVG